MGSSVFSTTAARLCRVRTGSESDEEPFALDDAGFLDPDVTVASTSSVLAPGMLVDPVLAARQGALVLLGEPGLGKTTAFEHVAAHPVVAGHIHAGTEHDMIQLDAVVLTDATFERRLGRLLRDLPAIGSTDRGAQSDSSIRTIIVDQLDESPLLSGFAAEMADALVGRDTSSIRLLIACRTADYPSALTRVLEQTFGACTLADLAPLRMQQAVDLADSAGVDGRRLIEQAIAHGAGAFASTPLTLDLLVRIYRGAKHLPGSASEIFRDGCRRLVEEHDPEYRQADHPHASGDERLAVAGRIAALLLLSGRRTIWTGPELDACATDLRSGGLAGGFEQTSNGTFAVTEVIVREVLKSALFTGRGEGRMAFRHASIAAYLAARHLIEHQVPTTQLRSLFLVAADDSSTSIPAPLRETAAWLAILGSGSASWLAAADPESLASHSTLVESPGIRALIVASLLERAPEIELGEYRWARTRWQLGHPGFAEQLATVLSSAGEGEPADWATLARVRLSIRLVREAEADASLVEPLLRIVENDDWSAHMRGLAMTAAYHSSPGVTAERLLGVLDRLADPDFGRAVDPDDELRGQLLDLLWPHHLSTEAVLPHLRPRLRRSLFGSYALFLSTIGNRLADDDIDILLTWMDVQSAITSATDVDQAEIATGDAIAVDELLHISEVPLGRVETDLIDEIVDRVLLAEGLDDRLPRLARLFLRRLERYEDLEVPRVIDRVDEQGEEIPECRELRRAFVKALLREAAAGGDADRGRCWTLTHSWRASTSSYSPQLMASSNQESRYGGRTGLVSWVDFGWALDSADAAQAHGEAELADAFGALASLIYNPEDPSMVDLISGRTGNPAWKYLHWWFEPVVLDSPEAQQMREQHAWSRTRETEPEPSTDVDQHRELVLADFDNARGGDSGAFWRLAWNLQLDPVTGRGTVRHGDDIMLFPGIQALGDGAEANLIDAASRYLRSEEDHASEWLGTDRYDKRAWAGYLALALLHRHGLTAGLGADSWTRWCGALIWFHAVPHGSGDRERKQELLAEAAKVAPGPLAEAWHLYIAGTLARQERPWEVELLDVGHAPELRDVAVVMISSIHPVEGPSSVLGSAFEGEAHSVDANDLQLGHSADALPLTSELWEQLLTKLVERGDAWAWDYAVRVLATTNESSGVDYSIAAAAVMMRTRSREAWPEVSRFLSDEGFAHELGLTLAAASRDAAILAALTEDQLGEVYNWLATQFPPEGDREIDGVHAVSPDEQARHWRDSVLRELAGRGSSDAVRVLAVLSGQHPSRLGIAAYLQNARSRVHANAWQPPTPEEVAKLLADASRRLVRSGKELADLLVESLRRVEVDLPGHCELLWDRLPEQKASDQPAIEGAGQESWRPKPEAALSAYVSHELELRLAGRGVVVNREVLVRPTNAYGAGDRTDILVEALQTHDPFGAGHGLVERAVVVIEVKGAWNRRVKADQREQLVHRYLPEAQASDGIYLVGWFPPELWTEEGDGRRGDAMRNGPPQELRQWLENQATEIAAEGQVCSLPLLLTVNRPRPGGVTVAATR